MSNQPAPTPEQVAEQLIRHCIQREQADIPSSLRTYLNNDVVTVLGRRVVAEAMRNAHEAFKIVDVAASVADIVDTSESEAMVLWLKGIAFLYLNQYQQSIRYSRLAEVYYQNQNRHKIVAGLKINQMVCLQELGRFEEAIELSKVARSLCEMIGKEADGYRANLEMNIAWCLREVGNLEAAEKAHEQADSLYVKLGNLVQAARNNVNFADLMQQKARFAKAEDLLQKARATLMAEGCDQEVARVDLNLGILAFRRAYYQKALLHLEVAHDGFEAVPNYIEVAVVDHRRSLVYRELNLLRESIQIAVAAEELFIRLANLLFTCKSHLYGKPHRINPAISSYAAALAAFTCCQGFIRQGPQFKMKNKVLHETGLLLNNCWTQCCSGGGPSEQGAYTTGGYLYQHVFWSATSCTEYKTSLDSSGNPIWSSTTNYACSTYAPGSGDIESYTTYVSGGKLREAMWRSGNGYNRDIPIKDDGTVNWTAAPNWTQCCSGGGPSEQGAYVLSEP